MDIMDIIAQAQGGRGVEALGRKYNLDPRQARAAVDELAPAVMAGLRREAETPDDLSGLLGALVNGNHRRYLEGDDNGIVDDGNAILGHVFGSKDVSRAVAANAAQSTGVSADTLKQMLPQVAAMVMGALNQNLSGGGQRAAAMGGNGAGGGLGDLLGQVLGGMGDTSPRGSSAQPAGGSGGLQDMLGQILGGAAGGGQQAGGANINDILGSIFGEQAKPEVREQASKQVGGALGDLLGGSTDRGRAADQVLQSAGYRKKTKNSKLDR